MAAERREDRGRTEQRVSAGSKHVCRALRMGPDRPSKQYAVQAKRGTREARQDKDRGSLAQVRPARAATRRRTPKTTRVSLCSEAQQPWGPGEERTGGGRGVGRRWCLVVSVVDMR